MLQAAANFGLWYNYTAPGLTTTINYNLQHKAFNLIYVATETVHYSEL